MGRTKFNRTWGDCHGYFLVATGYADMMLDPIMNLWDIVALVPVIEGAGGTITDWRGNAPLDGYGIIATNGDLHAQVLQALNPSLD
jgi:myo-inositol-1(or 4)-monophosphatase